jgi:colanic acid biosynthesis glycosyl transferase WcaI
MVRRATMHVLAVNQFYAPDHAATSQLLTDLCEDLVGFGDRVTVIASRGRYLGGGKLAARERIHGVDVVRPWATSFGKRSTLHRMSDYLSFWVTAIGDAARVAAPDAILALTTPPMIAAGAALVAAARRIPLVTWVQDVYPDVAVAFGVLPPRHPAVSVLAGVQRLTHGASRRIVALSAGMADRLRSQGAAPERIRVVPNWADGRLLQPLDPAANPFRAEHGLEGRFVVMYSGNLGVGHEFATLVGAARLLQHRCPEAIVLFVGDGARRAEAEQLAGGCSNVRFLPYQPRERLRESLAAADLHVITLREGLEGLLVPSKLYGVLAVGRPVAFVGPRACEVARVVTKHGIGGVVRPGDFDGLACMLEQAARSPDACRERGAAARRVFLDAYDRTAAVAAWRAVLQDAGRRAEH